MTMNERQFYDVGTGKKFTAHADDIKVKIMKGTRQPALRTPSKHGDYYVYKFVKLAKYDAMVNKYGKTK
jgi:hypothetical protein